MRLIHRSESWARRLLGGSALLSTLALSTLTGCPPPTVKGFDPDSVEDPALDPRGQFDLRVKPDVAGTDETPGACTCHYTKQDAYDPFLATGAEYDTITKYAGGKFLTTNADISPLLQKGAHQGPAFTQAQYDRARAWLQAEALARGSGGGSPTTPTVAVRTGDFYINMESLTGDPLSKITFTVTASGTRSYLISGLKLTAGPTTGIHFKHPRFIIFSATGANADSSDALATVDATVQANMATTVGSGNVLLSGLPATTARMALAFEIIEKVNPNPNVVLACKAYNLFNPAVKDKLASCAAQCHAPGAVDSRASQATNAFNMNAAKFNVDADIQKLCIYTLARISVQDPAKSVLILQAAPVSEGGTSNHPYKLSAAELPGFKTAVTTWAAAEK